MLHGIEYVTPRITIWGCIAVRAVSECALYITATFTRDITSKLQPASPSSSALYPSSACILWRTHYPLPWRWSRWWLPWRTSLNWRRRSMNLSRRCEIRITMHDAPSWLAVITAYSQQARCRGSCCRNTWYRHWPQGFLRKAQRETGKCVRDSRRCIKFFDVRVQCCDNFMVICNWRLF